jgi:hypothetical protein
MRGRQEDEISYLWQPPLVGKQAPQRLLASDAECWLDLVLEQVRKQACLSQAFLWLAHCFYYLWRVPVLDHDVAHAEY